MEVIRFALLGLATGAVYAVLAQGLVLVYRGSGLLNFAQGAIVVAGTFRPLEVYTSVGVMYFAILYPLTLWAARMEARVDQ